MGSHEKDPSSPKKALSRSNSTVSSKHSSIQQVGDLSGIRTASSLRGVVGSQGASLCSDQRDTEMPWYPWGTRWELEAVLLQDPSY